MNEEKDIPLEHDDAAAPGSDKAAGTGTEEGTEEKSKSSRHEKKKDKHHHGIELQAKIEELNDKYLRLYSEFDNYRKRTLREKTELSKTASSDVISDLLPVIDDFDRALKSINDQAECNAVQEGIRLIHGKLLAILERRGLKEIIAAGEDFNTDFHEAVTTVPAPAPELKGKVIDVVEKGYVLHEKVIRYARVVIGS